MSNEPDQKIAVRIGPDWNEVAQKITKYIRSRSIRNEVTTPLPVKFSGVLEDVHDERLRQDAQWGEQNHPDGTGGAWRRAMVDSYREACQRAAADGTVTWKHILLEEVYEALAEEDPAKIRAELIQVAAVCTQWCEAIDRRGDQS